MSRYALANIALAFVLTAVGAVKGIRILVDQVEDALSDMAGLS